jgi:cytochrome c-type biogenesis protein CcmH
MSARPRTPMAPALEVVAALAALALLLAGPATSVAGVAEPRPTLPTIERQVMCVTCKIPLNVAESPQADRERAFIQELIDRGLDEAQIKRALVAQYGASVLGLPSDHGFDATAYIVPLVVILVLLGTLALLLPSWRRRARARSGDPQRPPALDPADAARLDSDLARFD